MGLDTSRITRLGLPDSWIYQDSRAKQMALAGIDAMGITKAIRTAIEPTATRPSAATCRSAWAGVGAKR